MSFNAKHLDNNSERQEQEYPPTNPPDAEPIVLDPETTFYVRIDGGTRMQCNGKVDAPYPGTGEQRDCAWKHPFYAFSVKDSPSIQAIPGGSTVIIKNGTYNMGLGEIPDNESACYSGWAYDCYMKAIPSGTAEKPTRILGEGFNSGCKAQTVLSGVKGSSHILDLRNASHIYIDCLEITDQSNCIGAHRHGEGGSALRCDSTDNYASMGLRAADSNNVVIKNLNIHGLAYKGIFAGRISNWSLENVKINANGWVGWDGDIGKDVSSNSGVISFKNVEIAWNGCTENYPSKEIIGCWGQSSGGYGDGLGTHLTSGKWIFEDLYVHHNTSDGIDLLYTNDDVEITFNRTRAEGNAGNQIKTNGKTLIENSLIIGNCGYFQRNSSGLSGGENCRAMGSALSLGLVNNKSVVVKNNSIFSEGDAAILSACGADCDYRNVQLDLFNNIVVGYADFHQSTFDISAFHWHENSDNNNDGFAVAISSTSKNIIYNVKNNFCPAGDNLCNTNPLLKSINNIDQIQAMPMAGSPAIDAANMSFAPLFDLYNKARTPAADIGAIEH